MVKWRETLDSITARLFLIGLATSKLKDIPIWPVSFILAIISLISYLIGYITWFAATLFYPDKTRHSAFWYGLLPIKEQYQIASVIGTIATIICFLSIPWLIVPAFWLFFISNAVWCIAEYHKYQFPPKDTPNYSSKHQYIYLQFTLCMTASCLLMAIMVTIAWAFPPVAFVALITSIAGSDCLTLVAFYFWGHCQFDTFKPDNIEESSYQTMLQSTASESALPIPRTHENGFTNELPAPSETLSWRTRPIQRRHSDPAHYHNFDTISDSTQRLGVP